MARLRLNNVHGEGGNNPITLSSGATTTASWVSAPGFATIVAPDYYPIVVEPNTANEEVVYLTAFTSGATSGTVLRAQEGTSGITHTATAWVHGLTTEDLGRNSTDGKTYQTATTGRTLPWFMPWGQIGYAQITANQTAISAITDITSLTLTWTAVAGRIYKTTLYLPQVYSSAASQYDISSITDGSNVQKGQFITSTPSTTQLWFTHHLVVRETGLSGSVTRKGRMSASAGTCEIDCTATTPGFILVEDIGPSANPS